MAYPPTALPNDTGNISANKSFELKDFNDRFGNIKAYIESLKEGIDNTVTRCSVIETVNTSQTSLISALSTSLSNTKLHTLSAYNCDTEPNTSAKVITSIDGSAGIPSVGQEFLCYFSRMNMYGNRSLYPTMTFDNTDMGRISLSGQSSMRASCFGYGWYHCIRNDNSVTVRRLDNTPIINCISEWIVVNDLTLWDGQTHKVYLAEDTNISEVWLVQKEGTTANSKRVYYNGTQTDTLTLSKGYYYINFKNDYLYITNESKSIYSDKSYQVIRSKPCYFPLDYNGISSLLGWQNKMSNVNIPYHKFILKDYDLDIVMGHNGYYRNYWAKNTTNADGSYNLYLYYDSKYLRHTVGGGLSVIIIRRNFSYSDMVTNGYDSDSNLFNFSYWFYSGSGWVVNTGTTHIINKLYMRELFRNLSTYTSSGPLFLYMASNYVYADNGEYYRERGFNTIAPLSGSYLT